LINGSERQLTLSLTEIYIQGEVGLRVNDHCQVWLVEEWVGGVRRAQISACHLVYLIITPALAQVFKDMSQKQDNMCDNYMETGKSEY